MFHFPERFSPPWIICLIGFTLSLLMAFVLVLFGIFTPFFTWIPLSTFLLSLLLSFFSLWRSRDQKKFLFLIITFLFAILIAYRTEPSLYTGRDQGSIAIAAWELATHHELAFRSLVSDAFFQIYGPGRALNFPGFAYTESGALITQFPLGYTTYLALFVQWFGSVGYLFANAFLYIISLWLFLEITLMLFDKRLAYGGTFLLGTSFLTLWITQLTLTENLALPLFLSLVLTLTASEQEGRKGYLPIAFLSVFLLAMTRIEGFIIAALVAALLLIHPALRTLFRSLPKRWLIPALLAFLFFFLRDFFMNLPFYVMIGKAVEQLFIGTIDEKSTASSSGIGPIFFSYGLFPIILLGLGGLFTALVKREKRLLLVTLLALPTLVYLIKPEISPDAPWLLRRYAWSVFPFLLIMTLFLFEKFFLSEEARIRRFLFPTFLLLFLFQFVPAYRALSIIEYSGLPEAQSYLAQEFQSTDLILIDREATGDHFAMLPGPLTALHRLNAVYFFNPEDLDRLDHSPFHRTLLLIPEDSLNQSFDIYGDQLKPLSAVTISETTLFAPAPFAWPRGETVQNTALLFEIQKRN